MIIDPSSANGHRRSSSMDRGRVSELDSDSDTEAAYELEGKDFKIVCIRFKAGAKVRGHSAYV
jgi:hypothetical protein